MRQSWESTTTSQGDPESLGAWIEVDIDDEWTAAYRVVPSRDTLVIGELRVFPRTIGAFDPGSWSHAGADVPPGGLPTKVLRKIKVGLVLRFAQRQTRSVAEAAGMLPGDLGERLTQVALPAGKPNRRRGRRNPTLLARVAVEYERAYESTPKSPIPQLAKSIPHRSEQALRDLVRDARVDGFLSPARGPGAAGGRATQKARDVLAAPEGKE